MHRATVIRPVERGTGVVEVIRPHAAAIHDGHDMLRLRVPGGRPTQRRNRRDRHLHRQAGATQRLDRLR